MLGSKRLGNKAYDISKVGQRLKLNQLGSKEPVWQNLAKGLSLGYRPSSQTWVVRRSNQSGKRQFYPLGDYGTVPENLRFDIARTAALSWLVQSDIRQDGGGYTVLEAVNDYIHHVASEGRPVAELENRRNRTITGHALASIKLHELKTENLRAWKLDLSARSMRSTTTSSGAENLSKSKPKSAASINREMVLLKAALNFAYSNERSGPNRPWLAALSPMKVIQGTRKVYLDKAQRYLLMQAIHDQNLKDFISAQCLIPIRPGAMADLRVKDFDPKHKALTVARDKAGAGRTVLLPDHLVEIMENHSKDKSPDDRLFIRSNGLCWQVDAWKKPVANAVIKSNLPPGTTVYSIRHSVITDLLTNGIPASVIAKLAGTSIAMLERNYSKVLQDQRNRSALECLK